MCDNKIELIEAPAVYGTKTDERLYLIQGNVIHGPVHEIVIGPEIQYPPPVERPVRVKVLHFNDCHGRLTKLTPTGSKPVFSRLAGFIHQTRRQYREDPHTAVIVLSAGDDQIGSTFDHLLGTHTTPFHCHAPYRLYSRAGVDMTVIGNHDLDLGTTVLRQSAMQDAHFPLLSANIQAQDPLANWVYPAAVLVRKGIRIGVIGISTSGQLRHSQHDQYLVEDPRTAVQNLLPVLRKMSDVVIILSHLGYSLASDGAAVCDAGDVELARSLPHRSVDLIVGGHTHHILNASGLNADNIINGIPIVQAGSMGDFIGEVDISLPEKGSYVSRAVLHPVGSLPVDEAFERMYVRPLEQMIDPILSLPLGIITPHPDLEMDVIQSHFATGESALANFFADAMAAGCRRNGFTLDFAAVDRSAIYCGLPDQRTLTFADCYRMMPYSDMVTIYTLTGGELSSLLQDNVRRFQYPDSARRNRGFLQFSAELRYVIRFDFGSESWQAADIRLAGEPLHPERTYVMATTSFARTGARGWEQESLSAGEEPFFNLGDRGRIDTGLLYRDEMVNHILSRGGITPDGGALRDGRLQVIRE